MKARHDTTVSNSATPRTSRQPDELSSSAEKLLVADVEKRFGWAGPDRIECEIIFARFEARERLRTACAQARELYDGLPDIASCDELDCLYLFEKRDEATARASVAGVRGDELVERLGHIFDPYLLRAELLSWQKEWDVIERERLRARLVRDFGSDRAQALVYGVREAFSVDAACIEYAEHLARKWSDVLEPRSSLEMKQALFVLDGALPRSHNWEFTDAFYARQAIERADLHAFDNHLLDAATRLRSLGRELPRALFRQPDGRRPHEDCRPRQNELQEGTRGRSVRFDADDRQRPALPSRLETVPATRYIRKEGRDEPCGSARHDDQAELARRTRR